MGDTFAQLLGNKMTHADGRKNCSEWSKKTNKTNSDWQLLRKNAMAPMQGIVINAVAAVMDYALWLFF